MTTNPQPTEEEWRTLARQAVKEQDPGKIVAIAEQIVEAYQRQMRKGSRPPATFSTFQ
jgi:hypothetical protein